MPMQTLDEYGQPRPTLGSYFSNAIPMFQDAWSGLWSGVNTALDPWTYRSPIFNLEGKIHFLRQSQQQGQPQEDWTTSGGIIPPPREGIYSNGSVTPNLQEIARQYGGVGSEARRQASRPLTLQQQLQAMPSQIISRLMGGLGFPNYNQSGSGMGMMGGFGFPYFGMGGMGYLPPGSTGFSFTTERDPQTGGLRINYTGGGGGGGGTGPGSIPPYPFGGQTQPMPSPTGTTGPQGNPSMPWWQNAPPDATNPGAHFSIKTPWGEITGLSGQQWAEFQPVMQGMQDAFGWGGMGGGMGGGNMMQQLMPLFMLGLMGDFGRAHQEGKQANEQRYLDILNAYNSLLGGSLATSAGLGQEALRGYQGRLQGAMDLLGRAGRREAEDIANRYDALKAELDQDLINRGLANTTVRGTMERGIEESRSADLGRFWDRLVPRLVGTQTGLEGDLLSEAGQQRRELLDLMTGIGGQVPAFMERREDTYPSLTDLANLMLQVGAAGYAGQMGFPWQPNLLQPAQFGNGIILRFGK